MRKLDRGVSLTLDQSRLQWHLIKFMRSRLALGPKRNHNIKFAILILDWSNAVINYFIFHVDIFFVCIGV